MKKPSPAAGKKPAASKSPGRVKTSPVEKQAAEVQALVSSIPHNRNKAREIGHEHAVNPSEGFSMPVSEDASASTLSETNHSAKTGQGVPQGTNATIDTLDPRARGRGRAGAHDQPRRAHWRQPKLIEGRPARPHAARGLHPPREDHSL